MDMCAYECMCVYERKREREKKEKRERILQALFNTGDREKVRDNSYGRLLLFS